MAGNGRGESIPCGIEIGGSPLGGNLGRNLPGGTLPYQPWAAKLFHERHAALSIDDPHVRCLPDNPPRSWTLPHLTKAIHAPKLLVLLYEVNAMPSTAKSSATWKIPEMDTPVSVASWSVVVAARPEKPWTCMVRRGSKMWSAVAIHRL